jgi:hypothetical protein
MIQHMPPMDFSTSCSIAPERWSGRAAVRAAGLKSRIADYHVDNFYPPAEDCPEMRYGAFVQLWSTRCDQGRVAAFSDSTIFSNFAAFTPGKPELMLGMIEWLNHRNRIADPRPWLFGGGLLILLGGVLAARGWHTAWPILLAAGLLGWAVAAVGVRAAHRQAMPPPQAERPIVRVVMDRTLSGGKLPATGFVAGEEDEFGIFERWILRLGYFTWRREGPGVFEGDLAVFLNPDKPISKRLRERMVDYVADGGKILVVDSPTNERSTANEMLEPFGISIDGVTPEGGDLITRDGLPSAPVQPAWIVSGGKAFARLGDDPVGVSLRHGQGLVTFVGFGSRFADANMGVTGDVIPNDELKDVFELEFSILRATVHGEFAN